MESTSGEISRRKFMSAAIAAIGGLIGAIISLPAIGYIIGPALQKNVQSWVRLGAVSKVEPGVPTLFKTNIERQTGWITDQEEVSAYVLTDDGQSYVAMSSICTHLGCRVRWVPERESFFCPCHNGVFDKDGNVISGPPPRPLDRFETKVEDGVLSIRRS
ncbi:MAG: ubiquinol-cytochrome c reductase iron-sulfur subunit [Chloroflexi bacterium]|nr:ubiquinol-cytochrome c reductase iron-sulfur subunit [Chloroflexota bacterium]